MTDPAEPLEEEFATVGKALLSRNLCDCQDESYAALARIQSEHRRLAALVSFIEERNPSVVEAARRALTTPRRTPMSDDFATVTEALGELSTYGDHADKHPMDQPAYLALLALVRIEARIAEAERQRDIAIHNAETVARNATTSGEAQRRRIAHLEGALHQAWPIVQYVSRGKGFIGVEPYPDGVARRVNAAIGDALTPSPTMTEVEAHVERMMENPDFREALNDDSPVEGRPAEEALAPYLAPTMTPASEHSDSSKDLHVAAKPLCPTCRTLRGHPRTGQAYATSCTDPFHTTTTEGKKE